MTEHEQDMFKIHLAHEGQMRSFMHSLAIGFISKTNNRIVLTEEERLCYDEIIRFFSQEAKTRRLLSEKSTNDLEYADDEKDDDTDDDEGESTPQGAIT